MMAQYENGTKKANPNKKKKTKRSEFEFCKVCKLNHDQGLRHKYFPNHKKSLSDFLSRFRNKLSDIRSFLKNPTLLSPQIPSRNRFWCVFCDVDVIDLETSFACADGIRHLSSAEHVKNLKEFFWKYGGSADQLDAFMVSDDDIAKWEKKCAALENEAVSSKGGCREAVIGPSSGMSIRYLGYQESAMLDHAVGRKSHSVPSCGRQWPSVGYPSHKVVRDNGGMVSGGSSHQGLQMLTQISSVSTENADGNVHSGAPPPWFEATEGVQIHSKPVLGDLASQSDKSAKSKKLNPKRVGAAWAERRKIELEKEKRGESVRNECDVNWLPNFGRVWQSGSRKESRKEFEKEKQKLLNVETQSEMPVKIQPYVSKRMRMESSSSGDHATG